MSKQDNLYDVKYKRGFLYSKIKNKKAAVTAKGKVSHAPINNDTREDEEKITELCDFMKQCVLPQDRLVLMERLEGSVETRRRNLYTNKKFADASTLLYALNPDLVRYRQMKCDIIIAIQNVILTYNLLKF